MISKAIQGFDWDKAFLDKSTEEKASILTKTILNIMSNFILNEIVTIDDRDAPWILKKNNFLIKNKTEYEIFKQKYYFKLSISNFPKNLQLIKSILNFTGPY